MTPQTSLAKNISHTSVEKLWQNPFAVNQSLRRISRDSSSSVDGAVTFVVLIMELLFIKRMNSFSKNYMILLLFSLIQNFYITFAENLTNEQNISPKILISYLKAPWINFNSSWQHAVAPACRDDIVTLFESAEAGEMWALKSESSFC